MGSLKVFSGRSNRPLAQRIAKELGQELGLCDIKTFSDGEIWVKFNDNVRGCDVYLVQSTNPPAENLLELLMMIDAARRASARKVNAVIPYFGYARQDRKDQPRVSITAKLVANLITQAGADRVITMDLHAPQIQGFFDIPVDHLYSSAVLVRQFKRMKLANLAIASPDVGGIKMARAYAKRLEAELIVIDKRRPRQNEAEVMNIIGNVKDKNILIVDDLVDTGGTLCNAVAALKKAGAKEVFSAATHPVLSGKAIERIGQSGLKKMMITDTLPLSVEGKKLEAAKRIETVTVARIFSEAIKRSFKYMSISSLFDVDKG
jgi:ribose-phosphate pyrophosphokinase